MTDERLVGRVGPKMPQASQFLVVVVIVVVFVMIVVVIGVADKSRPMILWRI